MAFDAKKVKNEIVKWIQDFFYENGKGCNAVVGISGGKDSSVVAALCVEALGKDRVIGVLMPNGNQPDIDCSKMLCDHLGIVNFTVNIFNVCRNIKHQVKDNTGGYWSTQSSINLPARIRMAVLYAVSQTVNGRVANTCNLSEDWVGYSTRYGDAAGDFSPLSRLTVTEVKAIGRELGLPSELVDKVPADWLCGKTDEENLGFTYDVLDRYIRTGEIDSEELKQKIDTMHKKNLFKLQLMPCFEYRATGSLLDTEELETLYKPIPAYSTNEYKVDGRNLHINKIDKWNKIFSVLEKAWNKNPELRFGQLIVNILGEDPFYISDKEALDKMKEYVEK